MREVIHLKEVVINKKEAVELRLMVGARVVVVIVLMTINNREIITLKHNNNSNSSKILST
jgi:hypothetical protein